MEDRSSVRSQSSTGGYATPDEELPLDDNDSRSVRFASQVEERTIERVVSDEEIDKKSFRFMRRPKLGKGLPARVFRKFPRCYACWCGMIFPLWFLVLLSLIGGLILGDLEFDDEVAANDAAMRRQMIAEAYDNSVTSTLINSPSVCYILYNDGVPIENLTDTWATILDEDEVLENYIDRRRPELEGYDLIVNITDFAIFLDACGTVAQNTTEFAQHLGFEAYEINWEGDTSLTFTWSRCVNQSDPKGFNRIFQPNYPQIYAAHPSNQSKVYSETWRKNRAELDKKYLDELRKDNSTKIKDARLQAFNRSIYEATAKETCAVNVAGTAWFWFTIMTTVGYGNQAPTTSGGRILIFTVGFVSILIFGGVLATAGAITSLLVNDFVIRLKIHILASKLVMMIVWGLLYLGWLVFMASHAMNWNRWRLEEDMTWQDGYWFAYISTTTIGLGDFYPAPEVMFIVDLLAFSTSFLLGFVLLSSFLTELSHFLGQIFPDISVELAKRLKFVGLTPFKGCFYGPREDFDPLEMEGSSSNALTEEPQVPSLPEESYYDATLNDNDDELKFAKTM